VPIEPVGLQEAAQLSAFFIDRSVIQKNMKLRVLVTEGLHSALNRPKSIRQTEVDVGYVVLYIVFVLPILGDGRFA
jgi:hypothetical protein